MPNYQNGKIYRIVCNETGEQYIGSTTQTLAQRLGQHTVRSSKKCKSWQIIERGNYAIVLIEEYPCVNKQQLGQRERHFIENMECVNKNIPTRTFKEYYETHRERYIEQRREYTIANNERLKKHRREYDNANREKITESHRKYVEANREKIAEQRRKNYEKNRDKILEQQRKLREKKKLERI